MSATPIPRTLSLTIFGDLDLSMITELPKGRKPIITNAVPPEGRAKAYAFIRNEIKKGRQAFVICPRIEPTTNDQQPTASKLWQALEIKTVKEEYEKLSKKIFPDFRVAMLHGKMKPGEKERVMRSFSDGRTNILVATSVVEVGVDVPNASIMMIEGAERFGLAQLYQFRGRVGRGAHQSYCLLFTDATGETTKRRLAAVVKARNGFELAEADLKLRGPGEFLGTSQTGMPDIAMQALRHPELVKGAREAAQQTLETDPELAGHPLLRARLENFHARVHAE
jgi:ATP-dependent DNA helicase RecG